MPLSDGNAQLQRALTVQLIKRRRIVAPTCWLRSYGSDPSAADALADSLDTDLEAWSDQNLGLRLVAGCLELGIKSGDDAFAHAFFKAADHLKVDARFAFGITRITSVILKVEDQELIDRWAPLWPKGYKDKNGHWTETTVTASSMPAKGAKAIWRHSRPLPGSILGEGVVVWRPKGRGAALDYEMGVEELEPRELAPTGMDTILRAIAYATLTYWVRVYLDGLVDWDVMLTRMLGGWIARIEVEGRAINAQGKSLAELCWCPISTREQALDLVAYLQTLGASGDLRVAYEQAEAALIRNPDAPVAGWTAIESLFGAHAKQGIRRAIRAGIDLDVIERLAEQYVYEVPSALYIDRDAIPKGLPYERKAPDLVYLYDNKAVFVGKKRHNPFRLFATSALRVEVATADMFPGEEPGAILRHSPVHGILKDQDWMPEEYMAVNIYRGFGIKPIGTVDLALMARVLGLLYRMLGLLTRDNPAQMLWLEKWIAWTIQHPAEKQQICPVIVGGQGIGKSFFGETLMRALFGPLAGNASASLLADNNFLITPFIGKLVTFIDEVRLETSGVINEIKKLVRQSRISGQVKYGHQREWYIPSRLILAANDASIGLSSQDAADRALFFIMAWTADNKGMNDTEFLTWAHGQKPLYAEFTDLLETSVPARQHLMRHFREIEVTQAELEDLTHSSRFDKNVVISTMSKAREVARQIAADARVVAGNDLTAWFNMHNLRGAILREDGRRSRVEAAAVMKEFESAGVIEMMSGGYHRFKYGYGKTLQEMGKAHNLELLPLHPTGPGDFDDNPVLSTGNPPPWRGNKTRSNEPRRPFNPSDDPDAMDDY